MAASSSRFWNRLAGWAAVSVAGPNVVAVSALALVSFFNVAFFVNTARSYPPLQGNIGFLLSLAVLLCALSTLLLALACKRYTVKPLLMLLFPAAATAA